MQSFSHADIRKFGPPPTGAKAFFIGDSIGGTGWEVELPGGEVVKYYVSIPEGAGISVSETFHDFPVAKHPELSDRTVQEMVEDYVVKLEALVRRARQRFAPPPPAKPSHLRLVK
jgi:hypothetical protein